MMTKSVWKVLNITNYQENTNQNGSVISSHNLLG